MSSAYHFMKKTTSLLLFLTLISCFKAEQNCANFKTGKFKFSQEINGKKQITTFIRIKDLQIETYNSKTDTATVRWVNDCEFILQKIHPKNRIEKKAISMKILNTYGKTYTFEYSFVGESKKQTGIVTKTD